MGGVNSIRGGSAGAGWGRLHLSDAKFETATKQSFVSCLSKISKHGKLTQ